MKINKIQNLIRFVAKSGISEMELELTDFKIINKNPSPSQEIRVVESPLIYTPQQHIPINQTPVPFIQQESVIAEKKAETEKILLLFPDFDKILSVCGFKNAETIIIRTPRTTVVPRILLIFSPYCIPL